MSKIKKIMFSAAMTVATAGIGGVTARASTVSDFAQIAVPVANHYGLYPSVMIAQALLESNSGQSLLASDYNNYFGIKWTNGESIDLPTTEYLNGEAKAITQPFQVYSSEEESFDAQGQLLANYYPGTLRANTSSYQDALAALQGVYATDPNYENILDSIIQTYDLTAFDNGNYTTQATVSTSVDQYSVLPGDSLWSIATSSGMTVSDLETLNNLNTDSILQIGQILSVKSSEPSLTSESFSAEGTYKVQEGDNLWLIALNSGTTVSALADLNGISEEATLQVGQILQLTEASQTNSNNQSARSYKVQSGDTISAIANNFGLSVQDLVSLNGLPDANALAVGQILNL
ncbi:LysM peptidoglycan-binding domain-containing protein [Lactovum miscens]|uniref:Peptidoglycan hydrolase n=1 Tax=Lactovum miscens TaxID=190387 RepID=A0A841C7J9_9LACT|nr:LysM peptidoglycan-binding domain-containing protein [Lactovum miscens]MBB5887531.1 LysM repeat protein [Lactovum miscens]